MLPEAHVPYISILVRKLRKAVSALFMENRNKCIEKKSTAIRKSKAYVHMGSYDNRNYHTKPL